MNLDIRTSIPRSKIDRVFRSGGIFESKRITSQKRSSMFSGDIGDNGTMNSWTAGRTQKNWTRGFIRRNPPTLSPDTRGTHDDRRRSLRRRHARKVHTLRGDRGQQKNVESSRGIIKASRGGEIPRNVAESFQYSAHG